MQIQINFQTDSGSPLLNGESILGLFLHAANVVENFSLFLDITKYDSFIKNAKEIQSQQGCLIEPLAKCIIS